MERGRGGREVGDREGEMEREAGREVGARAKPGNQLVKPKLINPSQHGFLKARSCLTNMLCFLRK